MSSDDTDSIPALPTSEAWWSFFSWLGLAYLQFFIMQFIADTRTRDTIVSRANRGLSISFYMQSIFHFIILFFWSTAAWSVWVRGAWQTHTGSLICYVVLLAVEVLAWLLFWGKFLSRTAAVLLWSNSFVAVILMLYAFSLTGAALLLAPYAIWEFVQGINFYRFGTSNIGVQFPRTSTGRLRESKARVTANAFFETVQNPEEHIVTTHEDLGAPKFIIGSPQQSPPPSQASGPNLTLDDADFDFQLDEE